ncbi:hypothetical protein MNEG_0067 [Monoraphidium neglectum]|uniref:Uncharacterized protein n=1 Tax=Monoraphidium neglectum TaxID=145388 RepID=A0A0D2NUX0_9CHLO|nr:hypothetical protein MNEG_0067 [Monoraphidium neglectum]KIZ07881.1 hypothetical protein MNEG_0067 [Monoraphidium neglectum]|eukprot:XP_013906900.1 hypothetical protein MNEG_0067 [Monoraphidium neglectum]
MSCFSAKGERERTELREMLELSNAQKEEARKAAEAAARRGDEIARQLAAKQQEAGGLSAQLRDAGLREARLAASNEALAVQVASLQKALERAGAQRDELSERATELTAERKQAVADVRRLTRDREYLKHRVDRMQKALSMLESVLDDTLRENQGGIGAGMSDPRGAAAAAALRQSREAMSELWSKAGDGGGNGRALGSLADEPEELPRGCGMKDQHNYGLAAYRS